MVTLMCYDCKYIFTLKTVTYNHNWDHIHFMAPCVGVHKCCLSSVGISWAVSIEILVFQNWEAWTFKDYWSPNINSASRIMIKIRNNGQESWNPAASEMYWQSLLYVFIREYSLYFIFSRCVYNCLIKYT